MICRAAHRVGVEQRNQLYKLPVLYCGRMLLALKGSWEGKILVKAGGMQIQSLADLVVMCSC